MILAADEGGQLWTSVLNPAGETWEKVKTLLAEAYENAVRKYTKREKKE